MNITKIATMACKIKKPNKETAFNALKQIIDSGISENNLAILYSFFIPPIPSKSKTIEAWIAKAKQSKDSRSYLNYIYVKDGLIMACDGHRAHLSPTDIQDGFYDTALTKIDREDHENYYPDIIGIIPEKMNLIEYAQDLKLYDHNGLALYKLNGLFFQKPYIDDALAGITTPHIWLDKDNGKVLILDKSSERKALIISIKL